MLRKIISVIHRQPSKVKKDVKLGRPSYVNRHGEQNFLILATGPSLRQYQKKIQEFIDKYKPVVMAGNFIDNMFIPDYHAFVNRGRFCNYVKHTSPASKVLLSPYFSDDIIKAHYKGSYEEIAFENKYPSDTGEITISNGIIYAKGGTIATLLIAIAIVMGGNNIFIAGMDGYSKSNSSHHYSESDDKKREELLQQERSMNQQLECLAEHLKSNSRGEMTVITPTAYEQYYKPIEDFFRDEE